MNALDCYIQAEQHDEKQGLDMYPLPDKLYPECKKT